MEVVMAKGAEVTGADPTVIGGVLKSRGDEILFWRVELAENGNVVFNVGENGLLLVWRKAAFVPPSGI